ncbi:DUF6046 domain-containing protein [Bacteroidales bacterium OttesenSCG-928-C19]|nr:DUF6046 domain-containing protein [Bacteroidales bacterium OttesenSCG-928-C19]
MNFNFAGRFESAFNFVPGSVLGLVVDSISPLNVQFMGENEDDFDELKLYNGTEEYLFAYRAISDSYAGVFATPPMLSIRREKTLIETPIDNSDIVVVERYNTKPFEITMKGLLIDMDLHTFPLDKMEQLNEIFEANHEWNVASKILNKLKVEAIYMRNFALEFVEGFEDTIAYTISTKAIRPLEYQLTNLLAI